ncbi:fimbria/pilus outer membrane usher protein [Fontimonas sp. SYSU GA230001]|uniref:fimbria/pilus outer membrane usher protein n=1 Tax=Fontimonas sp. SYSU GA230001 TaxID=3142450 RepID=UPI0032B3AF8C
MRATTPWWSAWIGLDALILSLSPAAAAPPASDWFASDCPGTVELHPAQPLPLLLRVLTRPDDAGTDALLLRLPDGSLYAPRAVFAALDLPPPGPPLHYAGDDYHGLERIPGLRYAIDPCRQTLSLDRAGVGATTTRRLTPRTHANAPPPEPGAWLQTQALYLRSTADGSFSALIDGGLFGNGGLARNSLLQDDRRTVRLDSTWQHDDPQGLTRLSLGDGITRGGSFGRSLRFGGVQWGREFSLRPDLVTFPLPQIGDASALPSAVDVYVNDSLRARDSVPAGPFALTEVPVMSGAGEIQLVITDLLGRSRVVSYEFYAAPDLLRPGLSDYTVEAGFQRRGYGIDSFDYGSGFGAATGRYGLNDNLTVEGHAEAGAGLWVGGIGYALLLPRVGVLGGGIARGGGDSRGGQMQVSFDRQAPGWSYGAQYRVTSAGFVRLGEQRPPSLRRSLVRSSWHLPYGASLSLGWLADRSADGRVQLLSLGYSQQLLSGIAASLGASLDLTGRDDHVAFLTLSWAMGPALSAYAYGQHAEAGDYGRIGMQKNPLDALDWSARAAVDTGLYDRVSAGGDWRTTRATLHADVEDADQTAVRLGVDTGVVVLGREAVWTRPLSGPFALVETSSPAPVDVSFENRHAGTTQAGAPLLLPELLPYQSNRVAVAQADFGIEQRLDRYEQTVVAPGYGGVRVRFAADTRVERRLRLVLADGTPVPSGSDVTVAGTDAVTFVGARGETLLTQAPGRYRLRVRWTDGGCEAGVSLAAGDSLLQPMQTVVCSAPSHAESGSR